LQWPEREPSRFAAGGSGGALKICRLLSASNVLRTGTVRAPAKLRRCRLQNDFSNCENFLNGRICKRRMSALRPVHRVSVGRHRPDGALPDVRKNFRLATFAAAGNRAADLRHAAGGSAKAVFVETKIAGGSIRVAIRAIFSAAESTCAAGANFRAGGQPV
jgi:hypothetical protein